MKTVLFILVGVILASSSVVAAPACLQNTSVAALLLLNAGGGCDVVFANDTKRFSNFVATGSGLTATATLEFSSLAGLAGYNFGGAGGSFVTGFTLGYTATVVAGSCAATFTCSISGRLEDMLADTSGAAAGISVTESVGASPVLTLLHQSDQLNGLNTSTLTKLATYNGLGTLVSFESDVYNTALQQTGVPEPVSISMIGAGLLGLGLLRRVKK